MVLVRDGQLGTKSATIRRRRIRQVTGESVCNSFIPFNASTLPGLDFPPEPSSGSGRLLDAGLRDGGSGVTAAWGEGTLAALGTMVRRPRP